MRRLRTILLATALSAVLGWIALSEPEGRPVKPDNGAAAATTSGMGALPVRAPLTGSDTNPFAPRDWGARPQARPHAAPAPSAPPLPFRFAGRVYQKSGTLLYLARGTELLDIAEGKVLDGEYRVDAVSSSEVAFVYLPTGQRQVLALTMP